MTPYFDRDGITLFQGDCLDVLPTLGPVDHVITDPPWSEVTHLGARTTRPEGGPVPIVTFDAISDAALGEAFSLCGRLTRRWVIATIDWRHMLGLETQPPDGLRFVRFGIWHKPNGAPQFTGDRPATGWEAVAILHAVNGRMRWNGGGHAAVWTHCKVNSDHPTGKPLPLLFEFIHLFTDPGDLVLDPFMGSGTTGVACAMLGRRFIGIELSEEYAAIAARRIEAAPVPLTGFTEALAGAVGQGVFVL